MQEMQSAEEEKVFPKQNAEEEKMLPKENVEKELSPEEILKRAKRENEKLGDERQRGRLKWGNYAGFIALELAVAIVLLVKVCTQDAVPTEIFAMLFTGIAAQNIAQACVCVKKLRPFYIVICVLIAACAVAYWVFWILGLCGVPVLG